VSAKAQIRSKNQVRVTFLIEAQDRENILLPVVALFDELKSRKRGDLDGPP
jgi:hypothetical protein